MGTICNVLTEEELELQEFLDEQYKELIDVNSATYQTTVLRDIEYTNPHTKVSVVLRKGSKFIIETCRNTYNNEDGTQLHYLYILEFYSNRGIGECVQEKSATRTYFPYITVETYPFTITVGAVPTLNERRRVAMIAINRLLSHASYLESAEGAPYNLVKAVEHFGQLGVEYVNVPNPNSPWYTDWMIGKEVQLLHSDNESAVRRGTHGIIQSVDKEGAFSIDWVGVKSDFKPNVTLGDRIQIIYKY